MTDMNVNNVSSGAQGIWPMQQKQDNYEKNIRRQIASLQEEMETLTADKKKTADQKKNEKQEIQNQIQDLKVQLQQYLIQKRQREAAERQEAADRAAEQTASSRQTGKDGTGLSGAEMGVILSLSGTKEQIAGMKKIRTDLEGKLRTAESAEVQKDLQEKIDNLNEGIGKKIQESRETIHEHQKAESKNAGRNKADEADKESEQDDNNKDAATLSGDKSDFDELQAEPGKGNEVS